MEVVKGNSVSGTVTSLFVWYVTKKSGLIRSKISVADVGQLTLKRLRTLVNLEVSGWEWADAAERPMKFDLLHQSRVMETDEDVKKIGPLSVVTVIKKDGNGVKEERDLKSAEFIAEYAACHNLETYVQFALCSLLMRTAFLNGKFLTVIKDLGDSDMLEGVLGEVPELKSDPVALAIIQDPFLYFHFTAPESLKKLATVKPWAIEGMRYLASRFHQEKEELVENPSDYLPHIVLMHALFY